MDEDITVSNKNFLPENTFLWHWMQFCQKLYPKIVTANWWVFFAAGCMLLNTAGKVFLRWNTPLPGTMFLALLGKPAAGKGRIIDCIKKAINGTWISELFPGSKEGIEERIAMERMGILIWDEMGEIAKGKEDYLVKTRFTFNKMYYLDSLYRSRTKDKSTWIKAMSYYTSALFAGLPQDWKAIEGAFLGGFERRVLPLQVVKARSPFEVEDVDYSYNNHLNRIRDMIGDLEDTCFLIDLPDMSSLREKAEAVDEKYETTIEEYAYKFWGALRLNQVLGDEYQNINDLQESPEYQDLIPLDTHTYYMISLDTMILTNPGESPAYSGIKLVSKALDISGVTWSLLYNVRDETLARCLEQIDEWIRETGETIVRRTKFQKTILQVTNSNQLKDIIYALRERGNIKEVNIKDHEKYIILNLEEEICPNCSHYYNCYQWFSEGKVPEGSTVFSILPDCDDFEQ